MSKRINGRGNLGREIQFRAKHKLDNKWVAGNLVKMFGEWHIQNSNIESDMYLIYPETLGQSTGLKDRHGVTIFEDDIVRRISTQPFSHDETGIVTMIEACWFIDSGEDAIRLFNEIDENVVIGNAIDNFKLLGAM